jgi:two-component system, cell cycle response regulator CpdR
LLRDSHSGLRAGFYRLSFNPRNRRGPKIDGTEKPAQSLSEPVTSIVRCGTLHFQDIPGATGMTAGKVPSEILLVEDDEGTRVAYQRLLEAEGYKVAAFDRVGGAMDLAKTGYGHLLLTDVRLRTGEPHGVTLALMIRLSRPNLPIILMTAYPELRGFIDPQLGPILTKPIDTDTLLAAVRTALGSTPAK